MRTCRRPVMRKMGTKEFLRSSQYTHTHTYSLHCNILIPTFSGQIREKYPPVKPPLTLPPTRGTFRRVVPAEARGEIYNRPAKKLRKSNSKNLEKFLYYVVRSEKYNIFVCYSYRGGIVRTVQQK